MTEDSVKIITSLCKVFEGFSSTPYSCPAGVPTIGFGSTRYEDGTRVTLQDPPVSEGRAEAMLYGDILKCINVAVRLSPILVGNDTGLAAIGDFIYNLGTARYRSSTLKRRIDSGDWERAGEEIQRWVFSGGKKLNGLIKRRQAEAQLIQ